ncbi:MAG: ECF transporter S component [Gemmiger sp.]|uniref:ECF transporter S component n=1 Tax=Gemmiger sp. TaxID=2049027 RepID=UPI002E78193D|nr:ECF transporter S component [Gemmiger sp.]MEE0708323.1 ECF transporter S component [Gemmiger sp.]
MEKTITIQKKPSIQNVRMLTMTAVLSAIAFVLAFFEFPVPLSPSFARMDLSDLPALIGAFAYGPVSGVLIELVKNALQLLTSSTGGIGELANFIMGSSFVVAAGLIYKHHKTKKTAILACLIASVIMGVVATVVNYFILLPVFEAFMPLDQLIASFSKFMPFIKTKLDVVLFNAFPFNLLKGIGISIVTMLLYKRLTPILKGRQE